MASIFSSLYHKEDINMNMKPILRDIYVYLISLIIVIYICWDSEVTTLEAVSLISLYPIYLWTNFYISKKDQNERNEKKSIIKESLPWRKYYGILDYKINYFPQAKQNKGKGGELY